MTGIISQEEISAIQNDIAEEFPTCVGMNRTRDFIFGEPRDYYENYLDNEFERGHK